jgi:uncharacterized protein YuzE
MISEYDKEVDVLLIKIRNKKPVYGEDIGKGIIVHYDKDRNPVEIEILSAKHHLVNWIEQALEVKKEVGMV